MLLPHDRMCFRPRGLCYLTSLKTLEGRSEFLIKKTALADNGLWQLGDGHGPGTVFSAEFHEDFIVTVGKHETTTVSNHPTLVPHIRTVR